MRRADLRPALASPLWLFGGWLARSGFFFIGGKRLYSLALRKTPFSFL
jgi:hypothetical protein